MQSERSKLKWLTVVAVLTFLVSAVAMADPMNQPVGATPWDLLGRVFDTVPMSLLAIAGAAWIGWRVLASVLDFVARRSDPEVQLRDDQHRLLKTEIEQVNQLRRDLGDAERRVGYLLIMVRELEGALHECVKCCPDCGHLVEEAASRARRTAAARGLLPPDATVPQAVRP